MIAGASRAPEEDANAGKDFPVAGEGLAGVLGGFGRCLGLGVDQRPVAIDGVHVLGEGGCRREVGALGDMAFWRRR